MGLLQSGSWLWLLFLWGSLHLRGQLSGGCAVLTQLPLFCVQIMPSPNQTSSPGWRGERSLARKARGARRRRVTERTHAQGGWALVSGGKMGAWLGTVHPCPQPLALPSREARTERRPLTQGGLRPNPLHPFHLPPPLTSGNRQSVLCSYDLVFVSLFVFNRFHI